MFSNVAAAYGGMMGGGGYGAEPAAGPAESLRELLFRRLSPNARPAAQQQGGSREQQMIGQMRPGMGGLFGRPQAPQQQMGGVMGGLFGRPQAPQVFKKFSPVGSAGTMQPGQGPSMRFAGSGPADGPQHQPRSAAGSSDGMGQFQSNPGRLMSKLGGGY